MCRPTSLKSSAGCWPRTPANDSRHRARRPRLCARSARRRSKSWKNRRRMPRPNWMPMITTGQRPAFASDAETLEGLSAQAFDPRKIVFLPQEAQHRISATNGAAATIVTQSVSPQRIRIDAIADKPSLVVVAQSFYHWWKPTVDGRPVTLWRANHAFQAVEVPAGRHQVEFVYRDRAFETGAIISSATMLGCGALLAGLRRFKRKHSTQLAT